MDNNFKTVVDIEFNDDVKITPDFLKQSILGTAAQNGDIKDLTFYEEDSQIPSFLVNNKLNVKEIFDRYISPLAALIDGSLVTMHNGKEFVATWNCKTNENDKKDPGLGFA